MGALRAISAIFGTSAGLDREQPAELHFVGRMKRTVSELRLKDQFRERKSIDVPYFFACPVVTNSRGFRHDHEFLFNKRYQKWSGACCKKSALPPAWRQDVSRSAGCSHRPDLADRKTLS